MAKKKVQTEDEKNSVKNSSEDLRSNSSEKFEEIIESVDAGKQVPEDSNRLLKLQIIDRIEQVNNRYYLQVIKKYIDNLGG